MGIGLIDDGRGGESGLELEGLEAGEVGGEGGWQAEVAGARDQGLADTDGDTGLEGLVEGGTTGGVPGADLEVSEGAWGDVGQGAGDGSDVTGGGVSAEGGGRFHRLKVVQGESGVELGAVSFTGQRGGAVGMEDAGVDVAAGVEGGEEDGALGMSVEGTEDEAEKGPA